MTDKKITIVRWTTELGGYHELDSFSPKDKQKEFAQSLLDFFRGRAPISPTTRVAGVRVQDSADPVVGTAVAASVATYFIEMDDEDLQRTCDTYKNDKFPHTTWEVWTPEAQERLAAENAERKRISEGRVAAVRDTVKKQVQESIARSATGFGTATNDPSKFDAGDEDANDLF